MDFEEIVAQNRNRIHYHIHRLNIYDPHQEFYQEGLFAMWKAYQKYEPDRGPLATYFNYTIRHRLIDLLRQKNREKHKDALLFGSSLEKMSLTCSHSKIESVLIESFESKLDIMKLDPYLRILLTDKQWTWLKYYIFENMPIREIAAQEGVTVEAVKSWGKEAKKKLRKAKFDFRLLQDEGD